MQYIVEVNVEGGDIVGPMGRMRTWLDHRRIEPDVFRHVSNGAEITFRVDFKVPAEAAAFARAFGGRLIGSPTADANDTEPAAQHLR